MNIVMIIADYRAETSPLRVPLTIRSDVYRRSDVWLLTVTDGCIR